MPQDNSPDVSYYKSRGKISKVNIKPISVEVSKDGSSSRKNANTSEREKSVKERLQKQIELIEKERL